MIEKTITMPLAEYQKHEKRENTYFEMDKVKAENNNLQETIKSLEETLELLCKKEDVVVINFHSMRFQTFHGQPVLYTVNDEIRNLKRQLQQKIEELEKVQKEKDLYKCDTIRLIEEVTFLSKDDKVPKWIRRMFN